MINSLYPTDILCFQVFQMRKFFSKFDLKAGFWQLGIKSNDRPKTAFSIPNHHFQWTVTLLGLKTAPSLFHKVMTRIYNPILNQALIYIDDILLFSPSQKSPFDSLGPIRSHYPSTWCDVIRKKKCYFDSPKLNFWEWNYLMDNMRPSPI